MTGYDSTIPVSTEFRKWLKKQRIDPGEAYQRTIIRLLGLKPKHFKGGKRK